jgi:WXG100 family type VII secretion target
MSMNAGDILVNYGAVANVEDVLKASDQAVQQVLDQVNQSIQPMLNSWQGSSQDVYRQVQAKWNQDLTDMQSVLSKYAPTLDEMKINYGTTDNNLALQWSQIR